MRMLERSFKVKTRYGGGFVESINGRRRQRRRSATGSTTSTGSRRRRAPPRPRSTTATASGGTSTTGSATDSIPAVVGSFPEPFTNGIGGKRYPTTIECAVDVGAACKRVTKRAQPQPASRSPAS